MRLRRLTTILFFFTFLFSAPAAYAGNNGNNNPAFLSGFCDIPVDSLLFEAYKFMGTPYHFGGTTPGGFDCSGLVKFVFGKLGIELPRTSGSQAMDGEKIAPAEAKKGDLVFFGKSATSISHVGIVVSDPGEPLKIVHSSSSNGVSVTDVFSSSYWAPKFKFIKRIIPYWGNDEPVKQLLNPAPKNQANNK
jgi:hypothetical protein